MNEDALRDILYASVQAICANRKYYHNSGISSDYSHLTEEGEKAVVGFINTLVPVMIRTQNAALDQRAKDIVMKTLKDQ